MGQAVKSTTAPTDLQTKGLLPQGQVCFVFSDIEGSTKLLRRIGEQYVHVLHTHRRILRTAWSAHNGHEVGTEGDSFMVAFADPADAVKACLAAQQGLADHAWPSGVDLRVRMGIHRGRASSYAGEYVSLAVHQAARVAGTAVGRQVIASSEVIEALPLRVRESTVQFGQCIVRDFENPIELFSLRHDDVSLVTSTPRVVRARRRTWHPMRAMGNRVRSVSSWRSHRTSPTMQPRPAVRLVGAAA